MPATEQKKKTEDKKVKGKKAAKDGVDDLLGEAELSAEDEALKEKLELLVERIQDESPELAKTAMVTLKDEIRSSTSSMTSVPKPLKFLLAHYAGISLFYDKVKDADRKQDVADLLSVLAMTAVDEDEGDEKKHEVLRFRLESHTDIAPWGHQYIRHLACQIGEEFEARQAAGDDEEAQKKLLPKDQLMALVPPMISFYMDHQSEPEAVDILLEVGELERIKEHLTEHNYDKTCLYLMQCGEFLPYPEDESIFQLCYDIYMKHKSYVNAIRLAMQLDDQEKVNEVMDKTKDDKIMRRQLGYLLGWQQFPYGLESDDEEDDDAMSSDGSDDDDEKEILGEIISNQKLCEAYQSLATDLDVLEPKHPDDIYKEATQSEGVISARKNLASSYVNAFVNAGFGKDKLMTTSDAAKWIFQNKDDGMMAAVASLGMLMLWDADSFNDIDKYLDHKEDHVKAGARMAVGVACAGMRSEANVALAILGETVEDKPRGERIASIFGLGLAYAGQAKEDVLEKLINLITSEEFLEISAFASLALGMVFVGTCNDEVTGIIMTDLIERATTKPESLKNPLVHLQCLGLSILYMGKGDVFETTLELAEEGLKETAPELFRFLSTCMEACAFVGTGNVLKIQNFLGIAGEHPPEEEEKKEGENDAKEEKKEEKKDDDEDEKKESPPVYHQMMAVLGVAMVAMGEDIGREMVLRTFNHLIQYGEPSVKRAIPMALGLISISNPDYVTADVLSKLSHDSDELTAQAAILGLGLIAAGTNNARISTMLRQLTEYYSKEANHLFLVRISQGLLHMGKGLLTLNPYHSDRFLLSKVAMCGILSCLVSSFDLANNILKKRHYFLYALVCAMKPRMLITLDEDLKQLNVPVRVGKALDVVAQAGKRKRITGFQQHDTPVLLSFGQRAELATNQYLSVSPVLEGFVILKTNPEWVEEQKRIEEKKKKLEAEKKI